MSLNEALMLRRSIREFAKVPVPIETVGQLCWAAQGISSERDGRRTCPSAGALYPLQILIANGEGVFAYQPSRHGLLQTRLDDVRAELQDAALGQECVARAPVCFAITATPGDLAARYGRRAYRYCFLEAGHAAQNLLLQATALGLGAVPVGAFDDEQVSKVLQLSSDTRPVYLVPVGYTPSSAAPQPPFQ
jgi:SagB-type dehydrogenase family enzyme